MNVERRTARAMSALGDEARLRIMTRLGTGPHSIAQLTAGSGITRQAVTKHLRRLENAELVHCRARGRELLWSLDERWDEALARLRALVENG